MRARAWAIAVATCALAICPLAVAPLGPAAADTPTPSATAAAACEDDAPARILVSKLAPRAPRDPEEFFEVTGTVTNRGCEPLHQVRVRLRRGSVLQSRSQLARADVEAPATGTAVGTRSPTVDDELAPGESSAFDLRLTVDKLEMHEIGVYPLRIEVRAVVGDEGRASPAGSVQTYVPWFPDGAPARTRIAWLWPLVDVPRRAPREAMLDDELATSVRREGRLERALRAATAGQSGKCDDRARGPEKAPPRPAPPPCRADPVPLTYAVDPDLLFTLDAMTKQYSVADRRRTSQRKASREAAEWLRDLRAAAAQADVLALPYADPDVVALTRSSSGLADDVPQLRQLGSRVTQGILDRAPLTSVVWPPRGRITRPALEALVNGGASAAVLSEEALSSPDADAVPKPGARAGTLPTATTSPVTGLVIDETLSSMLEPDTSVWSGPRLAEQRWLAETAIVAAERPSLSRTILVAPRRTADLVPSLAIEAMRDSGRLPWLCAVPLRDVAVGSESCAGDSGLPDLGSDSRGTLEPPHEGDPTLSSGFLKVIAEERGRSVQLTESVLDSHQPEAVARTTSRLLRARARTESSAWRADARAGLRMQALFRDDVEDLRGKVYVQAGRGAVTLTSSSGTIQVNVVNALDQPVTVGVRLEASNAARLSTTETPVVTVAGRQARPVNVKVTTRTSGQFVVFAQLVDRDKDPYGRRDLLVVRSTRYGRVAIAVTGVGAGVLLAAAGVRITRRALRRNSA